MNRFRLSTILHAANAVGLSLLVCGSFLSNFMFGCIVLAGIAACIYWTTLTPQVFPPLVLTQLVIVSLFPPPDGGTFASVFSIVFLVFDLLVLLILQFTPRPSERVFLPLRIMIVTSPIVITVTIAYALELFGIW